MSETNYREVSILLVEDDDIDAKGIERAFKKLRLANPLYRAKDGIEGLEFLRKEIKRPNIILLDLNMPRMNGLEMLGELRADPELSDSVVFVLTTSQDDQDKSAAYKEHIAGYIVKSNVGSDFTNLIELLDHYWRIVELPVPSS